MVQEKQIEEKVTLKVTGMTCTNCANSIDRYLVNQGFDKVNVDFANEEASFYATESSALYDVIEGIEKLGFQVEDEAYSYKQKNTGLLSRLFFWLRPLEAKFIFSAILTVPLLLSMFFKTSILGNSYFQLALSTPVFLVGLYYFGKSAWYSLKALYPNMDVLIVMGSSAAFFYSLYATLNNLGHNYMFYETAATIITLVLLGNLIEKRAVKQTTSAVEGLRSLQPDEVKKLAHFNTAEEKIQIVEYDTIKINDHFIVTAGDRIALDGEVVWGNAYIDESPITGESYPVEKGYGENVFSGTLVQNGSLKIRTTVAGNATMLSQIIGLVKDAQAEKPKVQALADKISAIFVPVVICIAIIAFLINFIFVDVGFQQSFMRCIAVLVIACPCAMGLATPTAVVVGLGKAAQNGILVKGAKAIESFAETEKIVFDKTGTLTSGDFKIKKIKAIDISILRLNKIIVGLEKYSSHPIANSILHKLKDVTPFQFSDVKEIAGIGVMAKADNGDVYTISSYKMVEHLTEDAEHNAYITKNDSIIGWIDLEDKERVNVNQAIDYFNKNDIETVLLSGDKQHRCDQIAKQLNIKKVYAEQLPEDKLRLIEEWQKNKHVTMLGDGINDAPALVKANVGISVSDGTNIAMDASDMVLMSENINHLATAHKISKYTLKTIKQNLFWAFFYNIVAIPMAAAGFLSPMLAAFSMAFSDVIVIGNSLRFKNKKIQ